MKLSGWLSIFGALFVLAACAGPQIPEARLRTTGPNVVLNGRPAPERTDIAQGSMIATGANSSALVIWSDGTRLQLDENSDPFLNWNGEILEINLAIGWFLIDTGRMRVSVSSELADGIGGSQFAINVMPGRRFDLYLLDGRFALQRPENRRFTGGDKFSVLASGEILTGRIRPAERAAILARFARWDFSPPFVRPQDGDGPSLPDRGPGDDDRGDEGRDDNGLF